LSNSSAPLDVSIPAFAARRRARQTDSSEFRRMAASRSEVGGIGHLSELSSSAITGFIMMTCQRAHRQPPGRPCLYVGQAGCAEPGPDPPQPGPAHSAASSPTPTAASGLASAIAFSRSAYLTGLDDDPVVVEHCDLLPSESGFPSNGKSMVMSSRSWSMTSTGQCACTRIIPTSRAKDPLSGSGAATSPAASLGVSVIGLRRLLLR
jgi:hypothetical protein